MGQNDNTQGADMESDINGNSNSMEVDRQDDQLPNDGNDIPVLSSTNDPDSSVPQAQYDELAKKLEETVAALKNKTKDCNLLRDKNQKLDEENKTKDETILRMRSEVRGMQIDLDLLQERLNIALNINGNDERGVGEE